MKHSVIRISTGRPRLVYAVVIALVAITGALLGRIQIDTDPENMLPAAQSDRAFHNAVEERFTYHDAIVVGIVNETHPDGIYNVESLGALHRLSNAILALDGVIAPDLASLSTVDNIEQEGVGTIRFEWLMREAPITAEQATDIRDKVNRLPLLKDSLVSGDGKAATIYVPIASKDLSYPLSQDIHVLIAELDTSDDYHITGLPVAEDTFGHDMFVQMGISAPLAGLMIWPHDFRSDAVFLPQRATRHRADARCHGHGHHQYGAPDGSWFHSSHHELDDPDLPDADCGCRLGAYHVRVR